MSTLRRDFLKRAGIGIGAATAVGVPFATAQTPNGNPSTRFDVRTFRATGDGKTVDTPAVNKAIESAAAAGGGTVYFPAGTYLCYSVHLKSKVVLYLDM